MSLVALTLLPSQSMFRSVPILWSLKVQVRRFLNRAVIAFVHAAKSYRIGSRSSFRAAGIILTCFYNVHLLNAPCAAPAFGTPFQRLKPQFWQAEYNDQSNNPKAANPSIHQYSPQPPSPLGHPCQSTQFLPCGLHTTYVLIQPA